jgi:hypothetical protein
VTPTGEYKRKKKKKWVINFLKLGYRIYRHSSFLDTIYIAVKKQYITLFIAKVIFELYPFSLTLVGDRAIWLSYADSAMSNL